MKFWTIELAHPAKPDSATVVAVGDDGTLIVAAPKGGDVTDSHGSRSGAARVALGKLADLSRSGFVQIRDAAVLEVSRATPASISNGLRDTVPLIAGDPQHPSAVDAFKDALANLSEPAGGVVGKLTPNITVGDAAASLEGSGVYVRPNGEEYFPRTIGSHVDVAVLRKLRDHGRGALFFGAPGCGKTALVEAAFPDAVTLVGSKSTEYADLIGRYLPDPDRPGAYRWFDGPLVVAASRGVPFFADEVALIDPQELSPLYPLMDGRGYIEVPERPDDAGGTKVVAEAGFAIFGAYNPYAPGARISEALWSRFALKIEYTTDYQLARGMGVPAPAVNAALQLDAKLRSGAGDITWAPQMRELLRFRELSELFGVEFAVQALASEAPEDMRDAAEAALQDAFPAFHVRSLATYAEAN